MLSLDEARTLALALPEATTQDHHGMESFRVRGRIFATVPDEAHIRIMVAEEETRAAVAEDPEAFAPFFWGDRLACVVVTLAATEPEVVQELLTEAWRRKAPKKLAAELDGPYKTPE